jgi:hypothetical protein
MAKEHTQHLVDHFDHNDTHSKQATEQNKSDGPAAVPVDGSVPEEAKKERTGIKKIFHKAGDEIKKFGHKFTAPAVGGAVGGVTGAGVGLAFGPAGMVVGSIVGSVAGMLTSTVAQEQTQHMTNHLHRNFTHKKPAEEQKGSDEPTTVPVDGSVPEEAKKERTGIKKIFHKVGDEIKKFGHKFTAPAAGSVASKATAMGLDATLAPLLGPAAPFAGPIIDSVAGVFTSTIAKEQTQKLVDYGKSDSTPKKQAEEQKK